MSSARTHTSPCETSCLSRAEKRLRTIEMISKYRENKVRREFYRLEEELRTEQARLAAEALKDHRLQEYRLSQ